ncbi:MAG TPA: hypothetical protein DHW02_13415 [Ktedonobacter sp.]|nr:hypothetical protein [Ktedonobacter sp.]
MLPPMPPMPSPMYDSRINIKEWDTVQKLGDGVFVGNWFVFVNTTSMMAAQLSSQSAFDTGTFLLEPRVLFRGKGKLTLPGVEIEPTPLPACKLLSLTSDKSLYRCNRDTVRLLIAAPTQAKARKTLRLMLNGSNYAEYPLDLDAYGLCLWSMRDLPEGEYVAMLVDEDADECRFEVAEYRLVPLNAELVERQLSGQTLRYTLAITTFNQPYVGAVEIELQERGQRVGERVTLRCGRDGQCRGAAKLTGAGPYTLNVIAGERTATVALKGSEQQRRETVTISELGEARLLSLLPMPQSNECRGMYISRGSANTQPFIARRMVGQEIEITPRVNVDFLHVVVVNPVRGTSGEKVYQQVKAEQGIRIPVPPPYGVILLGAFINGEPWEGWCAVLRPQELQLQCEAPKEAKPGSRITITLKTAAKDRTIPVQLIVKDQRLIAASDPQTEFAAAIKNNMSEWQQLSRTGKVERKLTEIAPFGVRYRTRLTTASGPYPTGPFPVAAPTAMSMPAPTGAPTSMPVTSAPQQRFDGVPQGAYATAMPRTPGMLAPTASPTSVMQTAPTAELAKVRLSFPEVVHNSIVHVRGQEQVEVTLGDGMTTYTVEAFALSSETLDWQRIETSILATQPVYGELTVSPFVFPGDTVMGRLDMGAISGSAIVEVQHDGEPLPLFDEYGASIEPGMPIPSSTIVRFPVRPGTITSMVRDGRRGGVDVSERYVTAPGRLRHIVRRLHLLTPGQVVSRQDLGAKEMRLVPALDQPFKLFIEGAVSYPHGCIEQSSTKLLAMYVGYVSNLQNEAVANEYAVTLPVWYQRIKSMYLPHSGFCMYPPSEGGRREPDTHYAPLAVKHLINLPTSQAAQHAGVTQPSVLAMLDDLRAMANDAATYYNISYPPKQVNDCHDAYQVVIADTTSREQKAEAVAYVRTRFSQRDGKTFVQMTTQDALFPWLGYDVASRAETAYAAASLLLAKDSADVALALAATNYVTGQTNASGRLYSTVDTAAGLALMNALREVGIADDTSSGNSNVRVALNGQEMLLSEALTYQGEVESVTCLQGVVAVQVTSEIIEDWSTFKGQVAVEVRLEKDGEIQQHVTVGDALDLVIQVRHYEPGLIAHVCLPDALSRIVGGGQVKHFTLDFHEQNTLRVPLAVTGSAKGTTQHWAVIVRNMFKQEQIGNPGLLEVEIA